MNKEEYYKLVSEELDLIKEMIKAKNSDYTSGDPNSSPFQNFRMADQLDICPGELGLILRMLDKIQRVKAFVKNGKLEVKSEGYLDSCRDLIGYSLLLMGMLKEREESNNVSELPKMKKLAKQSEWE